MRISSSDITVTGREFGETAGLITPLYLPSQGLFIGVASASLIQPVFFYNLQLPCKVLMIANHFLRLEKPRWRWNCILVIRGAI